MKRKTDLETQADELLKGQKRPERPGPKARKRVHTRPERPSWPRIRAMTEAERREMHAATAGRAIRWTWK